MSKEAALGLYHRVKQLYRDITEVLQLRLAPSTAVADVQYARLYNELLAKAEELTQVKPPLSQAPTTRDAGSFTGVLIALKALTGQLAQWLQDEAGLKVADDEVIIRTVGGGVADGL